MNTQFTHGYLKQYFNQVGYKFISSVEVDPAVSNEHEFNGVSAFKKIFGIERFTFEAQTVYLSDEDEETIHDKILFTWYDARKKHPSRTEYRLYYSNSPCIDMANKGDLLLLCESNKSFTFFIAKAESTIQNQLMYLFGIDRKNAEKQFKLKEIPPLTEISYSLNIILEKIGINVSEKNDISLNDLIKRFPNGFPATKVFSSYVRSLFLDVNTFNCTPDECIMYWMNSEEYLFKKYEKFLLEKKIKNGFKDVDEFISFSLGVHNRRKSRAGYALEHHLCALFSDLKIQYSYNKVTEGKIRPDFIFPSIIKYHDDKFPIKMLNMLGVKNSCKDRWRQILSEAEKIKQKHLFTLEPGISKNQTDEMKTNYVQLVVPEEVKQTFSIEQQNWIINLNQFTNLIKEKQKKVFSLIF